MHWLSSHCSSLAKKTCFFFSPHRCPWGFFLSLSSLLLSISSYTGSENQQTEQLSISYTVYRLTLVSFFILSAWAPFIFSYMPHQSFPIFPGSPLAPAFRLPVLFFTLPLLLLIFQLRVPTPYPAACFIRRHQGSSARLRSLSPAELLFLVLWYDLLFYRVLQAGKSTTA